MKHFLVAASLFIAMPIWAQTAQLFRDGKFAEAARAGATEATPAATILAARSLMAVAAYETRDKARALATVRESVALLDSVLAKQPKNAEALLQKGIAVGYVAKLNRSPGGAKEARRLMDAARALDPKDALAWAALAGWHGESIATLGSFMAGTVLGAKKSEFVTSSGRALDLDPASPVTPTYSAFTLLALDAENAPLARGLLQRAVAQKPRDGFEALLKRQAEQVLPLLVRGDVAGASALAKRLQPFGTL
jgi:hypothetical protein